MTDLERTYCEARLAMMAYYTPKQLEHTDCYLENNHCICEDAVGPAVLKRPEAMLVEDLKDQLEDALAELRETKEALRYLENNPYESELNSQNYGT